MSKKSNQLTDFLKNKPEHKKCRHGVDMWCGNCINFGQEVSQRLPDGTISKGHFISNMPLPPDNPNGSSRTKSNIFE